MNYAEAMQKSEIACERARIERRALEAGRRESDREIQVLKDNLRLAVNLLFEAIGYVQGKEFSEQQLTALEIGLEVVRGNDG